MNGPAPATIRSLFARICRIRLARWVMRGARALDALAERLLPEDLRRKL